MELAWVRTIRKGQRPDLASYALEREFQIIVQLEAVRNLDRHAEPEPKVENP